MLCRPRWKKSRSNTASTKSIPAGRFTARARSWAAQPGRNRRFAAHRAALHVRNEHSWDRAWSKYQQKHPRTQDFSLFAAPYLRPAAQPYLGHRHHPHSPEGLLDVSGGRSGLVLTLCGGLGDRPDLRAALCPDGCGTNAATSYPYHLEQ
jgi:hypothetical protein